MEWTYNGKPIKNHSDLPSDTIGFVYVITYTDKKKYVGKKLIRSMVRLKPTVAQLKIRKNYVRKEWVDKPFKNYNGSSKNTDGLVIAKKEIIELCATNIDLTYCESKWLFRLDVLCDDAYLNDCIGGTYYSGKITKGL